MDLLKEAFIEGYKQRAESSNLIFDNASRMYAIALFDKWKSEQLLLHNVVGQSELLVCKGRCDHGYKDEFGNDLFCSIKEKSAN